MATDERDRLAAGARSHAELFSWSDTADGLIDSYSQAIAQHVLLPVAASGQ